MLELRCHRLISINASCRVGTQTTQRTALTPSMRAGLPQKCFAQFIGTDAHRDAATTHPLTFSGVRARVGVFFDADFD
jgi:hypothetical protein